MFRSVVEELDNFQGDNDAQQDDDLLIFNLYWIVDDDIVINLARRLDCFLL